MFSPDSRLLAAAGYEHVVRVYDGRSGALVRSLEAPAGEVRALAFSPDGKYLAGAGQGGVIRIWDLARGHRRAGPGRPPSAGERSGL